VRSNVLAHRSRPFHSHELHDFAPLFEAVIEGWEQRDLIVLALVLPAWSDGCCARGCTRNHRRRVGLGHARVDLRDGLAH
jgi:hypothetical protein